MGMAKISRGSNSDVYNTMYYLSGEKSSYNWVHDATTNTVYSSTTFTSQTYIPYVSSNICYYIFDETVSISADNEYTDDDDGNGWTLSSLTAGSGEATVVSAPEPTMTALTWTVYTIALGDVLYHDGALSHYGSSIYSTRTAIGVVFNLGRGYSGDPSAWTHGYALALREFNYCAWSSTNRTVNSTYLTTYTSIISDYAGYTKTLAITKVSDFSSSTFPAAYKAWNYSAKSKDGSSDVSLSDNLTTVGAHWFLPSGGQWFLILENLGKITETPVNQTSQYAWYSSTNNSSTARDNINVYITPIINAGYTTSTVSPTKINLSSESVAVRKIPFVSNGEATTTYPLYDNTYKTSTETGSNIISVVLFGAAPDLCITVSRTGSGYEKTPSTARDSMRPIIGF